MIKKPDVGTLSGFCASRKTLSFRSVLIVFFAAAVLQLLCTIHGGLFEDTAIAWDEALRLYAGQLPWRDYAGAGPPLTGVVAWLFLVFSGNHLGIAMVLLAVCANTAAAFFVQWLVWRATEDERLSVVAGLFTGAWFLTIIGGWYYDHAAYLCVLAAAAAWLSDIPVYRRHILVGVLIGLSFWFKQTTGFFAALAFGIAYLCNIRPRTLLEGPFWAMAIATVCSFGAVLGALWLTTDHAVFIKYFVTLPSGYSGQTKDYSRLMINFATPYFLNPVAAIRGHHFGDLNMYLMVIPIYAFYAIVVWRWRLLRNSSPLRFSLMFLFLSTMLCVPMVGRLLTHLIWGLGGVFAIAVFLAFPRDARARLFAAVGLLLYTLVYWLPHLWVDRLARPGVDVAAGWHSGIWPVSLNSGRFSFDRPSQAIALEDIAKRLKDTNCQFALYDDNARLVSLLTGRAQENFVLVPQEVIAVPADPKGRAIWEGEEIRHMEKAKPDIVIVTFNSVTRRFRVEHNAPVGFVGLQALKGFLNTAYGRIAAPDGIDVYVHPGSACAARLENIVRDK